MAEERSLLELLRERRQTLDGELRGLDDVIVGLQRQKAALLDEIERVDYALRIFDQTKTALADEIGQGQRLTIKEAVIKVLENAQRGLTALQILERLRTEFEMEYPRTSLSPQLSRLKNEGKIGLKSGVWYLIKETA